MLSVLVLWVSVEMTMLERGTALPVDQPGRRIGELGRRIAGRGVTLGLEEQRPARAEAPQHVVEPRADGDEFGLRRALQVGPAEAEGPLEAAVLVEQHAGRDERRPRQVVRSEERRVGEEGGSTCRSQ